MEPEVPSFYDLLRKVQMELKAPKNQHNNFGNYNYRNCEDILEAVKPLLDKNNLTLIISDELTNIGDRYYIKATAQLLSHQGTIEVSAFAREEESKKGMDPAQITGSASSYARKYALNGLFNIDDTKDADAQDNRKTAVPKKASASSEPIDSDMATPNQVKSLFMVMKGKGYTDSSQAKTILHNFAEVKSLNDLTRPQASELLKKLGTVNKALLDTFWKEEE